jgi:predicted O-linked N-acetylglucosamine transferase (SPINDLY family)
MSEAQRSDDAASRRAEVRALLDAAARLQNDGRVHEAATIYRRAHELDPGNVEALHGAGMLALRAGRPEQALALLDAAIQTNPHRVEVRRDLGLVQMSLGRQEAAMASFRRALALAPSAPQLSFNVALIHQSRNRFQACVDVFRRAIAIDPASLEARTALGTLLVVLGNPAGAVIELGAALRLDPRNTEMRLKVAQMLQDLGRLRESLECYEEGTRQDPQVVEFHNNRGNILLALGRARDAAQSHRMSLALRPGLAETFNNVGNALGAGPDRIHAGRCYRRAISIDPTMVEAMNGLGRWLHERESYEAAIEQYRAALKLEPEAPRIHSNLATALRAAGENDESLRHYRKALSIAPSMPEVVNNLASASLAMGDVATAIVWYRRTLVIAPEAIEVHRNLLTAMLYASDLDAGTIFAEHRRFARQFTDPAKAARAIYNVADPEKRLRIGYLSSDLRHHPIARNIWPWLTERDRRRFEIICFAEVAKTDHVTDQLKHLVDGWETTVGLDDEQVARLIRRRGIDILVILAGHFDRNRALVAQHRPAPVVISAHDGTTSAVPGTDYLLADAIVVPRLGRERFVERVIRLPIFSLQRPIDGSPIVEDPPVLKKGYVTFGSFNNPSKISPATVTLWANAMRAVPGSQLLLKYRNVLGSKVVRDRLFGMFGDSGIDGTRILMASATGAADPVMYHLALYNHIDIALDTFPFNGSTTTFEALWMGVPVVTMIGDIMMARWSASMLTRGGRAQWIAATPKAFVDIVADLAADAERLKRIRHGLRPQIAISPLCSAPRSVRYLERAYRAVWRRWCRRQRMADGPTTEGALERSSPKD